MTAAKLLYVFAGLCAAWLLIEFVAYRLTMSKSPDVRALLEREQASHDAFMATLKRMGKE